MQLPLRFSSITSPKLASHLIPSQEQQSLLFTHDTVRSKQGFWIWNSFFNSRIASLCSGWHKCLAGTANSSRNKKRKQKEIGMRLIDFTEPFIFENGNSEEHIFIPAFFILHKSPSHHKILLPFINYSYDFSPFW